MKHKSLRAFIRGKKHLKEDWILKGELVIDAVSFFRNSYRRSGCQFILGGEYDRYASYMRDVLKQFSNVKCYVIYGSRKKDIRSRIDSHQNKIDLRKSILSKYENEYFDVVAFEEMVCKDLLEEMGIEYLVYDGDTMEAIITFAKQNNCPVLTPHLEMALYGISCITPFSLRCDKNIQAVVGDMYNAEKYLRFFRIHPTIVSAFLTITDEENPAYAVIPKLTGCNATKPFLIMEYALRWIQRKRSKKDVVDSLISQIGTTKEVDEILALIYKHDKLLSSQDLKFESGFEKIAPFINLKNCGILSGSWLVADHKLEDAMLPALDIVFYALALLKQSTKVKITFIGRRGDISEAWEIEKEFDLKIPTKALHKCETFDLLKIFLSHVLPGFRFQLLKNVPEECWLIIISLVFYVVGRDLDLGYAVLLSFVIVGPVSNIIGPIKRSLIFASDFKASNIKYSGSHVCLSRQDCLSAANAVLPMFYIEDLDKIYNKTVLHSLAEFKHCLQMMNYLNTLVGERVKSTKIHEAYNGTFVNNVIFYLKDKPDPIDAVRSLLGKTSVFNLFETIAVTFEECLLSVKR